MIFTATRLFSAGVLSCEAASCFPGQRQGVPRKRGCQGWLSVAARKANVQLTCFQNTLVQKVAPSKGFKMGKLLLEGGASWNGG